MSSTPTDTNAASGSSKSRRRLNADGVAILQDYWDKHPGEMPSLAARKSMTAQILKTPGNEFYRVVNTTGWFERRVEKIHKALPTPQVDPRFPSLSLATLEHLTVLLKAQRNPSSDVVTTWASLLASSGATYQDVVTWVHTGLQPTQPDHLPTPPDTATPEPSQSPSSRPARVQFMNLKQDPTSPVLPPSPPSHWSKTRCTYQPSPMSPSSPKSPGGAGMMQNQSPRVPALEAIIQGVTDAVTSPSTPPAVVPSTAAEFNAMYAPYEKQLSQLLHALESS